MFFFFFVDYFTYSNVSPTVDTKVVSDKNSSYSQKLHETKKIVSKDKHLLKSFVADKNVSNLFQYKYFTTNDWTKENKYQEVNGQSLLTFT